MAPPSNRTVPPETRKQIRTVPLGIDRTSRRLENFLRAREGSGACRADVLGEQVELLFPLTQVGLEELAHREAADHAVAFDDRQVATVRCAQLLLALDDRLVGR